MGNLDIFLIGVAGSFVIYLMMYRETRVSEFLKNPAEKWKLVIIDFFLFLTAGGLVATFALTEPTAREAFVAGISWQGVVGGIFTSMENEKLRNDVSSVNSELTANLKNQAELRSRIGEFSPDDDDAEQIPPEE